MPQDATLPLAGVRVVEVSLGASAVGTGIAGSLPGALLRDFGADVVRLRPSARSTLDEGLELQRAWDRGKEIVELRRGDDAALTETVTALTRDADVLLLTGSEPLVEGQGLVHWQLAKDNQRLVTVRIRPGVDAFGPVPDQELLIHARTGLLAQLRGHRPGPTFCDLAVASAGAALSATVGALARLYEREATGVGGWVETTLYDGVAAILPMIIGRVAHPSPSTTLLWQEQGPAGGLSYRCADGEYLQLWFGAKGAYESFLAHIGDPPSESGYTADTVSGALDERSAGWAATFATRDRAWWIQDLAGHDFRCEPVLRPGEALRDPQLRAIGLSIDHDDSEHGPMTVLGPVGRVTPVATDAAGAADPVGSSTLLAGVRVLDLSAYLAGPVTPQILAELGADVIKVEPTTGDAHRTMEPLFAAGQRGKRSVALDLKAAGAAEVLRRLFRWSDVVHHNSRVGLDERLGYDEASVRAVNPHVVYSHSSGFGSVGARALLAANDHLMQALSGIEAAMGGVGQPPTFTAWGAIDVTSGWLSACAVLAGLYAERRTGSAQSVTTTLLGAGLTLKSGAFIAGDTIVGGPLVDPGQTGYGAAYRIYRGADGRWFALAVPDEPAWCRLVDSVQEDGLPDRPPPLRTSGGDRQPAEDLLEAAFATKDAATWVDALRAADVPVELVLDTDRAGFISRLLDDPVGRRLGRVASYEWGPRGLLEQPSFPLRFGPGPRIGARPAIAALGEHTGEVLELLGFDDDERAELHASGTVTGPA